MDRRARSGTAISRRHHWHRGVDASPPPGLDLLDADDDAEAAASRALGSHDAADTAVPGGPGRASATPPKCPSHGREAEAVTEKSPESTDQELIGSTLLGKPQWMSQGSGLPLEAVWKAHCEVPRRFLAGKNSGRTIDPPCSHAGRGVESEPIRFGGSAQTHQRTCRDAESLARIPARTEHPCVATCFFYFSMPPRRSA